MKLLLIFLAWVETFLLIVMAGLLWQADTWYFRALLLLGLWLPFAGVMYSFIIFLWSEVSEEQS